MVPLLRMPQGPDKDAKHNAVVLKKGIEVGRNENVRTDDAKIRRRSGQGKEQREEKLYVYLEVNMIDDNETRMEEERGRDEEVRTYLKGGRKPRIHQEDAGQVSADKDLLEKTGP
jgi:hypothetical protein